MNSSIKAINYRITELENQIADETRRMAVNTQASRDETQRKLGFAKDDVARLENDHQSMIMERKNEGLAADQIKARGGELDQQKATIQRQIGECENTIKSAEHQAKDALVPYGKGIKQVLEKIQTMRWAGDKPLGPLGLYVKAKDPNRWGEILRNQLGNYLTAFAVTDARDRQQLKSLLVQSGKWVF
jgi:structural maintenance of chromosomes protein 6